MKKFVLTIIIIVSALVLLGCQDKKNLKELSVYGYNHLVIWHNPSEYEGFEVSIDDQPAFDTDKLYYEQEEPFTKAEIKPFILKYKRRVYGPITQINNLSAIDVTKEQKINLTNQSGSQEVEYIENTTDVAIITMTADILYYKRVEIKTRTNPLKIVLNNVVCESPLPFISFTEPDVNSSIVVLLEVQGERTYLKNTNLGSKDLSSPITVPNLYLTGTALLELAGGLGAKGDKGADAYIGSKAKDGGIGYSGGSGIEGNIVIINYQNTIRIKPGEGGIGGDGGRVSTILRIFGKYPGKQGEKGPYGEPIKYLLAYTLINGTIE